MTAAAPKILVVDDEPQMVRVLRITLTGHGYQVVIATTCEEALDRVAVDTPDIILLDVMLPDGSGVDVCRQLRSWGNLAPIIVLSALGDERVKVAALDAGADDYLTKPFSTDELLARVRAWLRRLAAEPVTPAATVLSTGNLVIDLQRHRVTVADAEVHLSPKEYDLLAYLAKNAGRVMTHRTILSAVWGPEYTDSPQYLHVFINHLRRKIEAAPSAPTYILTEPGIGYRFKE